jgi:CHAD domain-containing protein
MPKLNDAEKMILEKIANDKNQPLARRAAIILMSIAGAQPANIAKEVELTPQTVRHWLREFEKKGLAIFPSLDGDSNVSGTSEASVASPTPNGITSIESSKEAKVAPKSKPHKSRKTKKAKANNKGLIYPTRKEIGLEPTDTFAEAGRKVLGFHFARVLKYESGARVGQDIEALHNMRVATRRMRAAFKVFGSAYSQKAIKPLLAGLKTTGRVFGPVRDLDVFMEKLQHYQQTLPEAEPDGLQTMLNIWTEERQQTREQMLDYLNSKKYAKFKKNFLEFVKTPGLGVKSLKSPAKPHQLRHIAPGLIYEAYGEVRAYETVLDNAPVETLHQLRIAFKRLRYLLEFLQEILGTEAEMVIKEIKLIQDHLGDLQDAQVASDILREFLNDWEDHQLHLALEERQNPSHIVSYLELKLSEHHKLLTSFPQAWANFNRPEVRENLAKAVSAL